jgi:transcriptional regulator with XRE-family HTH domain
VPTPRSYLTPDEADERARRRAAFGAAIRALRHQAGLTQEQVALAAGLDRPFLVQIEGGKRSILVERLPDLAEALGVDVAELFAPAADVDD